uniref:Uncharacterized protein n=1 Tax=Physcomitrium patens TaxID=3218 RepID=A0A2K1JRI4_PHYPA|nr:hypothetical protein PHYPA_016449 [Physcomitrium patens]
MKNYVQSFTELWCKQGKSRKRSYAQLNKFLNCRVLICWKFRVSQACRFGHSLLCFRKPFAYICLRDFSGVCYFSSFFFT